MKIASKEIELLKFEKIICNIQIMVPTAETRPELQETKLHH